MSVPITPYAQASPGGLDADGCHVCRTGCLRYGLESGERHCHLKPVEELRSMAAVQEAQAASESETQPSMAPDLLFILFIAAVVSIFFRFRHKPGKPIRNP